MGDASGETPATEEELTPPPLEASPPPPEASPPPPSPSPPPPADTPVTSSPTPPENIPSPSPSPPPPAQAATTTPSPVQNTTTPSPAFVAPAAANSSTVPPHAPASSATTSPATGGSQLPAPSPPSSSSSSSSSSIFVIGGLFCGVFVIAMIVVLVTCCSKKKKKEKYSIEPPPPLKGEKYDWNSPTPKGYIVQLEQEHQRKPSWGSPLPGHLNSEFMSPGQPLASASPINIGPNQSSFSYEQLAAATSGFSQANLLGQGGFGYVHKGVLPNGKEVAVKSLKSGSGQGEREFQAEVEIISRVHHRHLVSLVGYCIAQGQRMLVYEFVPNKTLAFHLHGKGQPVMDWTTRMRIALGASKGLAYLHEDCHPRIIHRDIKASNILLDNNFEAMVADFGLAKLTSDNNTHVSTRVMGTFGYLAPEYAASGKLTDKSDVFSFGVMLLELITGRKPVDRASNYMEDSLVDWARPLLGRALENRNYDGIADPLLENEYDIEEMTCMVACASASIRHSAKMRPKMTQIARALEGDSSVDDIIYGPKPIQSSKSSLGGSTDTTTTTELYDTGAYNADMVKFKKMVMVNDSTTSEEEDGATSEYGLDPSCSSSDVSDFSAEQRRKI